MTLVSTRRLTGPVDLVDIAGDDGWLFARGGVGVAGRGEWARVAPDDVSDVLASLAPHVVAIGARPFLPSLPWDLVIPRYQVRVTPDGSATETWIGNREERQSGRGLEPDDPLEMDFVDIDDPAVWCDSVEAATRHIRAGRVDKVVLAREVQAVSNHPMSPRRIVGRLADQFQGCYLYSVDGLVGASPELLVERDGQRVRSQPMAGTTMRTGHPSIDEPLQAALLASEVYRHEHQLTIDMVHDTLLRFTSFLDFEPEPSIVELTNVAHLASRVEGELSTPPADVLELQTALHPTPAVSGRPRDVAIELIGELESGDRDRYGGTVGWIDGVGNGTWAVTIRCAQIDRTDPRRARIHAGCGLVGDSDPESELAESTAKLQAIISVLED